MGRIRKQQQMTSYRENPYEMKTNSNIITKNQFDFIDGTFGE